MLFHSSNLYGTTIQSLSGTSGIFIIAGQSNASGRGELNASNESPDPKVVMFANDYQFKTAYEPLDDPLNQVDGISNDSAVITSIKGHGFGLRAGKDLITAGLDSVVLIPCPLGGTSLSQWLMTADPFDRNTLFGSCNYRQLTASPNGVSALWWYQGESNSGAPVTYISQHTTFISQFRTQVNSQLPVIYVQLSQNNSTSGAASYHKIAEFQRQMETGSGYAHSLLKHHMVVTLDLPLTDSVHLNQTAQKELGKRIALSTREHVYGESVDGTGPRLLSFNAILFTDTTRNTIKIRFNKPVNASINQYDHLFRVYDDATEMTIQSVVRDPSDTSSILVTMTTTLSGAASVSYGDRAAPGLNISLNNVVKGTTGLPAPRFGPLFVEDAGVVDNLSNGFQIISGTWSSNTLSGKYGVNYFYHLTGTGQNTVRWTPSIVSTGYYEVAAWYLESSNRATNALFTIQYSSGVTTLRVNQTMNGSQWYSLGTYLFSTGTGFVELSDESDQVSKYVIADAVKFTYHGPVTQIPDWALY